MNRANESLVLTPQERDRAEKEVELAMTAILRSMGVDITQDHNTRDTPRRWARMIFREVCAGRFTPCPRVTTFPNMAHLDEIVAVGPLKVRSLCSHHLAPILGSAWIGYIPGDTLLGLSKFSHLSRWVFARPQIQEEATVQLADVIEELAQPLALGVVVRANHLCMTWRGVQEDRSEMTTSVMRGLFSSKAEARAELLQIFGAKGLSRMIEAHRYHDISCGHRVYGHENKCARIHGHNYRIHFHCASPALDNLGRVIDFGAIKGALCMWLEDHWDHRTLLWQGDPMAEKLEQIEPGTVVAVPFNPTAENMAKWLVEVLGPARLPPGITLVRCHVEETRKCGATFAR